MNKIIYLIISTLLLFSCSNQENKIPDNFDFGKTENGSYKNSYFNMSIQFNPDWVVQDKQQMNDLIELGNELTSGDDEYLKATIKAGQVNTAYLLSIFKYELGATVEYNPSFMVIAENTKNFSGIKDGSDYLFHAKKLLQKSQLEYYFEKEVIQKTIGKSSFHVMEAKIDYMGATITQEYMTTVRKGFSLSFVISYITEDEKNELYEIVNKIRI